MKPISCLVIFAGLLATEVLTSYMQGLPEKIMVQNMLEAFRALNKFKFPDPLPIPDFTIDLSLIPIDDVILSGKLNICNDAAITGLSVIELDPTVRPDNHTYVDVVIGVYADNVRFEGGHDLFLNITKDDDSQIMTGAGAIDVELVGTKFIAEMVIKINPKTNEFNISNLALHLGFDCIAINMEGTTLNRTEFDWAAFSTQAKIDFDNFWNGIKIGFAKNIQWFANIIFQNCTVDELMALDPACFEGSSDRELLFDAALTQLAGYFSKNEGKTCPARTLGRESFLPRNLRARATCEVSNEDPDETTEHSGSSSLKFNVFSAFIIISYFLF